MPTASLIFKIPFIVLYKQSLDYNFLKVFGCVCFPLLRPYNNHMLDFCSQQCVFLGYFVSHKCYMCISKFGHIYISNDVLFSEIRFPYIELFLSQPNFIPQYNQFFSLTSNHTPFIVVHTNFVTVSPLKNMSQSQYLIFPETTHVVE